MKQWLFVPVLVCNVLSVPVCAGTRTLGGTPAKYLRWRVCCVHGAVLNCAKL